MSNFLENDSIDKEERRNFAFQSVVATREAISISRRKKQPISYRSTISIISELDDNYYNSLIKYVLDKNESETVKHYKELAELYSIDNVQISPKELIKKRISEIDDMLSKTDGKKRFNSVRREKLSLEKAVLFFNEVRLTEHKLIENDFFLAERDDFTIKKLFENVKFKGKKITPIKFSYILLNKPKSVVTTTDDELNRKTVIDLVQGACKERIYPIGRLDRNTTGILLLTNDGELAQKLSHPSSEVTKVYQVELDRPLSEKDRLAIKAGIELEDGLAQIDEIEYTLPRGDDKHVGIELHIGKNRIVRRIFEHLGYDIVKLDRVLYAGLTKKNVPRSKWRYLTEKEIIFLKYFTGNKKK